MSKESETVIIQPAVASLAPTNPAGIESLLRAVHGEVRYLDLNEKLLLDWTLSQKALEETLLEHKGDNNFSNNLRRFGLNNNRVEEVTRRADEAREAFKQIDTYGDFPRFVTYKGILEDAAKIVSAPYITEAEAEYLRVHHNTFGYYNSKFEQSRESLLLLTQSAGLFRKFIRERAIPQILESNPIMVGISVSHPDQYVFAFQLAYHLRQARPEIITLFGGNTISRRFETWSLDDETNRYFFRSSRNERGGIIDGLIVSEGELALAQLSMKLVENPNIDLQDLFQNVHGAVFNHDGRIVFNALPLAFRPEGLWRRDDVYHHLTRGFMPEQRKMHSLVDGRVCTYECATGGCEFCAISKGYLELTRQSARKLNVQQQVVLPIPDDISKTVIYTSEAQDGKRGIKIIEQRKLGPKRMASEIESGLKEGFSVIDITDEQFTVDQALDLSRELEERKINVTGQDIVYACYMRIDEAGDKTNYKLKYGKSLPEMLVDPDIAKQLARGGLRFAQFGLETTYPPKMQAMVKGTSGSRVKRFGQILKNFADHEIMPHVFIIVGAPLKESDWQNRAKFAFEESVLGREVKADDLEILETIYNLKFLHDHREHIFTFKHAPYELSYGSPMAIRPQEFGLQVDRGLFDRSDLACSIPFSYSEGHGPSGKTFEDIMSLYGLWKKEEMPYQPVVQEFQYSHRIMQELGATKIREIARALFPVGEGRLNNREKGEKQDILARLWNQLAGEDSIPNIIRKEFPEGFKSYGDIYRVADLLEQLRKRG